MTEALDHVIVVGIDGSPTSEEAFEWAARQAECTGATLQAVMSWSVPVMAYGAPIPIPYDLDLASGSQQVLDQVVAKARIDHPSVKVSTLVVEGHPAAELIKASDGAELLVVGSRGHGEFAGMLLGSVSEHCVSHARCPVVVVRPR